MLGPLQCTVVTAAQVINTIYITERLPQTWLLPLLTLLLLPPDPTPATAPDPATALASAVYPTARVPAPDPSTALAPPPRTALDTGPIAKRRLESQVFPV